MGFELDPNYKGVPERIADFLAKHPEGSLRPVDPARPYWVETIGDKTFIVYAAAAFRTPDDPAPGIGVAWEPFPGTTPYTKQSELQNAETSAWGRAIVASLASQSKAVASAEDMRNRDQANQLPPEDEHDWFTDNGWQSKDEYDAALASLIEFVKEKLNDDGRAELKDWMAEADLSFKRPLRRAEVDTIQSKAGDLEPF